MVMPLSTKCVAPARLSSTKFDLEMKIMDDNWRDVPQKVRELYTKYAADATELVQGPETVEGGWILNTDEVGPVFISKCAFEWGNIPDYVGKGMTGIQKVVGGPNPLTATLLGGAIGAGLGYGGGWLGHKLAPQYVGEDAPRKWALIGALGGGAFPAFKHGYPNAKELGWKGWVTPSRYQGRTGGADTLRNLFPTDRPLTTEEGQAYLNAAEADGKFPTPEHVAPDESPYNLDLPPSRYKETLAAASALFGIEPAEDEYIEKAADFAGATLSDIPVDEWGRTIMYDPYLDNTSKAIAAGLPVAAQAISGSNWVSPGDVARVAANTALGRGIGWGMGQVARSFFGFTPRVQQGLQQAGMLAGAVRGVLGMIR